MRIVKTLGAISATAAVLWPVAALAHVEREAATSSFLAGAMHPLTGFDHLAAMLMVGLWAGIALLGRSWAPPAAFVGSMLAGFAYGLGGGALPIAESLILTSLVVLGLALCFAVRAPLGVAVAVVGLFAFAHGHAHGAELPHGAVAWRFAAGFAIATAVLHVAGLVLARFAGRATASALGVVSAAGGVLMLATG